MDEDIFHKVDNFFSTYPRRTYPKDQILIFAGENPDKVHYIVSGRVSQYDISYRGDEIVVNIFKQPAFFPMAWAINQKDNTFFYKTEEESVIHVAPPEDVVAFLKDNPDVMFNLLSRLYNGVDGILSRVVHLMSGSAKSRIMYELIIESRRFGDTQSDGRVILSVNENDLGSHSGLARETVSREIKHLKDKGLIDLTSGKIVITNLSSLEEQLGKSA